MPQTSPATDNRLQCYLSGRGLVSAPNASRNLAEKLSQMIDLSDSISLSESLRSLAKVGVLEPRSEGASDHRQVFLDARGAMLSFIATSFVSDASSVPFLLPRANAETLVDTAAGFQPFQRFYSLHQSEMDQRIAVLRKSLRAELSMRSVALAQLAALDRMMADTLADNSRRVLAALPRLLSKRFRELAAEHLAACGGADFGKPDSWSESEGWLGQFNQEMQSLLLAELDFRLLPALGLLEALETEEVQAE